VTTIASSTATTIDIGTSFESPRARLDPPTATTSRISCVAYAVDEIASDEKTASAIVFVIRWCSCSEVAKGRPTSTRLKLSSTVVPSTPGVVAASMPLRAARTTYPVSRHGPATP
jgi:hypothetical protein